MKKENKTYVLADVHGGYKALLQCLERSGFDYEKDTLISLGDLTDGFPETPQVIEELLKIKNLILLNANHDLWLEQWFKFGSTPDIWTRQGGQATIDAYLKEPELMVKHRDFFNRAVKVYVDDKKRLFVHGGIKLNEDGDKLSSIPVEEQYLNDLVWDRELYYKRNNKIDISPYSEIFIGHTSTWNISKFPFSRNGVYFMDSGGGFEGKLSIMNVDTHEFWQSDKVANLYPGFHGR